jgi:Phage minor structural protein GP20
MSTETTENTESITELQAKLDQVIAERDTMKTKVRDLEAASKGAGDLQKTYDELLDKHSKLTEEFGTYKSTIKQEKTNTHLQTALEASGAHNPARVLSMLDLSKLKIADDGTPDSKALADELNALKTSDPYLFKEVQAGNEESSGASTKKQLPDPKGAAQIKTADAYREALEVAKKAKDPFKAIQEVMQKFGKAK